MLGDVAQALDEVLAAYGRPYHLSLGDAEPPRLRLAGRGPLPHACLDPAPSWAAPLSRLDDAGPDTAVLIPHDGRGREFWQAAADGRFGAVRWRPVVDVDRVAAARGTDSRSLGRQLAGPLGNGHQLLAGSVVNAGVTFGENVLLNSGAVIEHDCRIGSHSHIASGATLCGDCVIGESVHIGAGAYIAGEETGLMSSLMGGRAEPFSGTRHLVQTNIHAFPAYLSDGSSSTAAHPST